ncbi:hypothetical protein ACLX1H_006625 [Fusarium chlamydosporum]
MSASTSSSDPQGYACEVTQDWDPRALKVSLPKGLSPALKVEKGDKVFVFQLNGPPESRYGYTQRPFGDTFQRDSRNVLQETLRELWRTVKANETSIKRVIPGMSEASSNILFHRRAPQYADIVFNDLVPQAAAIMANGTFDVNAFRTLPQVSTDYPKQAGIYLILYWDFGGVRSGNHTFDTVIYVGQTIQFQGRKSQHQQRAQTSSSIHYRLAKKAKRMAMVPLLLVSGGDHPPSYLDIAEFSMVCLLRTWYATLFRPSETSALGSYATDFDSCLAFSRLMREVSDRTGWAPERTYGLNWHTPILSSPRADVQWTSWYSESEEMFYYRTRRKILRRDVATEIYWQSERKVLVPTQVATEAGFEHGQSVHLVVEVKKRGNEYLTHPFRFVRYPPNIGPNPELEKLRSLAVSIQWLDGEGKWKQYYFERQTIWKKLSKTNVPEIYRQALFMLSNVEQTIYTNLPTWALPTAPARIHYLRYNHLAQKLVLQVMHPTQKAWPPDYTMEQNTTRLLQLFPDGPDADTKVGERPGIDFLGKYRKTCDMCFSQSTTTACRYDETTRTCQVCNCLNRPCTFSRSDDNLIDLFLYKEPLEELGMAPHMARDRTSMVMTMKKAPFDPDIEAEGQGELA